MGNDCQLSIIIVNFNTFELASNCIRSIYTHNNPKELLFEIILVDNASKECSPKQFLTEFPQLKLIENRENVGFGVANNQGMEAAKGEFILLLNSDTIVLADALLLSLRMLQKLRLDNPKIGLLGCRVLNADGSNQASYWQNVTDFSKMQAFAQALLYNLVYTKLKSRFARPTTAQIEPIEAENLPFFPVEGLFGAFVLLHREVWEQTKGFDPDFFLYCEETEWFRNRIRPRFEIIFYPEPQIIHLGGQSGQHLSDVSLQGMASYFLYWYKRGYGLYWVFVLTAYLGWFCNLWVYPFVSRFSRNQIRAFFKLIPIVFWQIPRYKRYYGSRPRFLRL